MVSLSLEHGNSDAILLRLCMVVLWSLDLVSETIRPDSGLASSVSIWWSERGLRSLSSPHAHGVWDVYTMSMDQDMAYGTRD